MKKQTRVAKFLSDLQDIKEKEETKRAIQSLISTNFGGSNEEQGKAVQLMRGLAFSDDPAANKFMQALNKFTSSMDPSDYTGGDSKEDDEDDDKEED